MGSTAVRATARPEEVPRQYQFIKVRATGLTRYMRCYLPDEKHWVGDNRAASHGDNWVSEEKMKVSASAALLPDSGQQQQADTAQGQVPTVQLQVVTAQQHGPTSFHGARFSQVASFAGATFHALTDFEGAEFADDAFFTGVAFQQVLSFKGSQFSKESWFVDAEFSGKTEFADAAFAGDAYFSARFFAKVTFSGAHFKGAADFDGTQFYRYKDSSDPDLRSAVFKAGQPFDDATFWD